MSAIELYTQIHRALDACVDAQVSQPTRARLALLVLGMMEAKSASPAQVGQALHRLGLSHAQPASIERRIRRLENDPAISDVLCFHPFAQQRWTNVLYKQCSLLLGFFGLEDGFREKLEHTPEDITSIITSHHISPHHINIYNNVTKLAHVD